MKTNAQPWRPARLCGGPVLLVLGIAATYDLAHDASERILAPTPQDLIFFGPSIALLGCLIFLRGFVWGERWLTRRKVLVTGLVMLAVGLMVVVHALATDRGGDASWAKGMVALEFAIYAGLPGLFLTLASFVLKPVRDETSATL